jgi:hypothetical protein
MTTVQIYKFGVTSDRWRCRQCRYTGRFITKDWYRRGFSSVATYRGGFLRCPNPRCQKQGGFMKRRRFDQVARLYELEPQYYDAQSELRAAVASQFPLSGNNEVRPPRLPVANGPWSPGRRLESADR